MHLFHLFSHSSKQVENADAGMSFSSAVAAASISSIVSKRCPRSGRFSLLNSQKSAGAKSGEYGGCRTIWVPVVAKNSLKTMAVWEGALSWCKNQLLFFHKSVRFRRMEVPNTFRKVSYRQPTIVDHQILDLDDVGVVGRGEWSPRTVLVFDLLTAILEITVPFAHIFLRHGFFPEGFL
uniref:Uncharacterized protein n=1 Tax=Anopheles atroparvus TaxID=41427 RepID=A0AAG5DWE2_ANOAO